jgi:hypothetical protein
MGSKIISDNNLDPNPVKKPVLLLDHRWDKTSLVLTNVVEADGRNSLGGTTTST